MSKNESERLKIARKKAGLTQAELGKLAGVGQSAIGNIETGLRGFGASIIGIANACKVNAQWLATGDGEMDAPEILTPNVKMSGISLIEISATMVPLISSKRAISWGLIGSYQPDKQEKFPVREVVVSEKAFALRVEGDSMTNEGSPNFPEGTVLIVDPERQPKAGDFVIAKNEERQEALFKRLVTDGYAWQLKSLNRDYRPIEIDDPKSIVIGVVVEYWSGGKL